MEAAEPGEERGRRSRCESAAGPPTEHQRAQLLMRSRMFMQAADPVIVEDPDGQIIDLNASAVRTYGWSRDELLGRSILEIIAPEYRVRAMQVRRRCMRGEDVEDVEWVRLTRDGRRLPTLLVLFPIFDEFQGVAAIVSLAKDISELKRREQLRRALQRAEERAEERERRALSRDLHDSVGQLLALARIRLAALAEQAGAGVLGRRVAEVRSLIGEAEEQARTLMFRVHPDSLDQIGLRAALDHLQSTMRSGYGLEVEVQCAADLPTLDDDVRSALYRSIRELLINVARHADTQQARIEIGVEGAEIAVTVSDAGRGFDPGQVEEGIGMFGVRDRIDRLRGHFELVSRPGHGTSVRLRVPVAAPDDA